MFRNLVRRVGASVAVVALSSGVTVAIGGAAAAAPLGCGDTGPGGRAYSVMFSSNDLYVFDTAPQLHVTRVVGGLNRPGGIAVGDGGRKLYIGEWGSGSVVVLDACTFTRIGSFPVGAYNYITQSHGRFLYTAVLGKGVSVIDTATDTIVREIPVPGLDGSIGVSPSGDKLYVITPVGVLTLDPSTGQQLAPIIPTGGLVPTWVESSPDGARLYLADTAGDGMSVVDPAVGGVVSTSGLPTLTTPVLDAVKPDDGSQVWMANGAPSHGITVYAADGSLIRVIPTRGMSPGMSFSPDGKYAYVLETGDNCDLGGIGFVNLVRAASGDCPDGYVRVYDTETLTQVGDPIQVGGVPSSLAF
jgi:DNA-binding beta-propeller fold protein YncE